jgi:ribosomal protein S18 acetylase RimI-like enzyme
MGFSTILLETNSSLEPALALYRSLGFEDIELDPGSEFERTDVRMRLTLGNNGAAT